MKARRSLKFARIGPPTAELGAHDCLKKSAYTYSGENSVATFSQLVLIGSFSYLLFLGCYLSDQF